MLSRAYSNESNLLTSKRHEIFKNLHTNDLTSPARDIVRGGNKEDKYAFSHVQSNTLSPCLPVKNRAYKKDSDSNDKYLLTSNTHMNSMKSFYTGSDTKTLK